MMNVRVVGVYGGTNIKTQKAKVQEGLDVIGNARRLMDLMLDGVLKTKSINRLIIDEVDEMLNLGFRTQIKNIIDLCRKRDKI
ncbi:MAG: DEAD/DEAH box helicase [Chitinophagales bacterium]